MLCTAPHASGQPQCYREIRTLGNTVQPLRFGLCANKVVRLPRLAAEEARTVPRGRQSTAGGEPLKMLDGRHARRDSSVDDLMMVENFRKARRDASNAFARTSVVCSASDGGLRCDQPS